MNIYLVKRKDIPNGASYDEYDSAIVAAVWANRAKEISPDPNSKEKPDYWTQENLTATRIASNSKFKTPQLVLASFNAG